MINVLIQAVEESLKSVNLFHSGFGDKSVKQYSGGMRRRLSVAIALIGNPKVVYMDELSTGLDPMSRNDLWNVIKKAKKDCTIILTSSILLKARYSSTRTLTIMTDPKHKGKVEKLMNKLSPSIYRFYSVSGTQKFILPRWEVGLYDVFRVIETLRHSFPVLGWGLADATLEDVFIRVVKDAQVFYDMGQEG
ncbi:hypothetical protein HU200_035960 [Digitaria exilis]|uniref:ABC transporter domain-containing protein n=1 Tax=Digitaria exilis TaxID=1010633 RepID=A0A835BMF5_9POAL|nr:hypothetical protein HU200_035960 [Digitaria exilis]